MVSIKGVLMVSRKITSGKHPVNVRLTEEEYKLVKLAAFENDMTPNEYMGRVAVEHSRKLLNGKKE